MGESGCESPACADEVAGLGEAEDAGGDAVGEAFRYGLGLWMCLEGAVCASVEDEGVVGVGLRRFGQFFWVSFDPVEDSVEVAVEDVFGVSFSSPFQGCSVGADDGFSTLVDFEVERVEKSLSFWVSVGSDDDYSGFE